MKPTLQHLAGILLLLPLAFGCARTAPFDELDKAPMTIMRLGQPPPPPAPVAMPSTGTPLIPGLPPDLQKMGEQVLQGAGQILPPGLIPPGLIPGAQPQPTAVPQQQTPMFKAWAIVAPPIQNVDDETREEILDIFGDEDSFQADRPNCFSPGMGISITRNGQPPVDLMISLSCAQAQGDGFKWPYKANGFTTDTSDRLSKIFQKFFGPVPPGA